MSSEQEGVIKPTTPNPNQQLETSWKRVAVAARIARLRIREHLEFDSRIIAPVLRAALFIAGESLMNVGLVLPGFKVLSSLHRSGKFKIANSRIERALAPDAAPAKRRRIGTVLDHAIQSSDSHAPASLRKNAGNVFPGVAIVMRSPGRECKGVLNLSYSYVYPWFHRHFDVEAISQRYHFVLEPSWSGFCSADLLAFTRVQAPVFVQAFEPCDAAFLRRLSGNLHPVPIGSNWWTDTAIFQKSELNERDLDFVMVAGWADFKRHHRFFETLWNLAKSGHRLRGACVGYPQGRVMAEIQALASHYRLENQVEFYERLSPAEVAKLLARSRVSVLWSRREGLNRAIIESLFVDTPIIVRDGFNYGHSYSYINEHTGVFASDRELGEALLAMVDRSTSMHPRAWVESRMTSFIACQRLEEVICRVTGEPRRDECSLAAKRNTLNMMDYLIPSDGEAFQEDYQWLREQVRP